MSFKEGSWFLFDIFIMSCEQDLEFEEEKKLNDLANQTQNLIDRVKGTQNLLISQLKGLFEGFRQFYTAFELDCEYLLKTIPLEDCCHNLGLLLDSDIELNMQYANQIKWYFREHWNF